MAANLFAVLALALGAGIAGVHAAADADALSERFDRWMGYCLGVAALVLLLSH